MKNPTLSDFIALNDQLLALLKAGVPVNLSLSTSGLGPTEALERINAAVARSVGQGASVTAALEENRALSTPAYRCLMEVGLQGGDLSTALSGVQAIAESTDEAAHWLRLALLYPAILCALAYAGLVSFCLLLAPRLQNLFIDLRMPSGKTVYLLGVLRDTLPYWIAIPPVLLLLVFWRLRARTPAQRTRPASRWVSWLPGTSKAIFEQRCANFASTLANALEAEMPLDEALRLTSGVWNDATLEAQLRDSAASPATDMAARLPTQLPAFLRWSVSSSHHPEDRVRNLRMAAGVYRAASVRRLEQVRVIAPMLTCVVIGGGVTLLYGLALFLPIVHLLRELAA